jgi:hypothetical protein
MANSEWSSDSDVGVAISHDKNSHDEKAAMTGTGTTTMAE